MAKPDLSTREGAVEHGARVFEGVKKTIKKLQADVDKLRPVFAAGPGLGLIGQLQAGEIDAQIRAIVGLLASAEAQIYTLHRTGTAIAQEHGVDIPTLRSGGPR